MRVNGIHEKKHTNPNDPTPSPLRRKSGKQCTMKITKNLTEGNITKNLLLYALPLMLSALLSQAYSTIDGIIAGKFISENTLGAISATGSFETVFHSLLQGFCAGFAIYIAHLFGQKSFAAIKRDVFGMMTFVAAVAFSIGTLAILFRTPIMSYLNVDPILWKDAETYFTIYTAGYAIYYTNLFLISTLHALGITSFSLYVSFMSAVLNIGGNLLTVVVFRMGVAGIAFSTLFSALAATAFYLVMLRKAFAEMVGDSTPTQFSLSCVKHSLRYTIPASIQQFAFHSVIFLIAPSINAISAAATTGYNISNRIYSFGTQGLWSASSAFACYSGQCAGVGDVKKIRSGLKIGFIMNALIVLPFVLVLACFARPIVSLFFPAGFTGEAYLYAVRYATVFLPFIYVQLVGHLLHAYMRSLGAIKTVLWISFVGSVTRLIATLLLIPVIGIDGAFLGQIISWAIDALLSIALFFFRYRTPAHIRRELDRIHRDTQKHA